LSLAVDVLARRNGFAVEAEFTARAGEVVALLGPNGAGKSTLVSVLAGLLTPERGRIVLDAEVLDGEGHVFPERRPIGVLFQGLLLLPHLSALENVAFPLRARGVAAREARDRARATLELTEALSLAEAKPPSLSGGEAQRVALARALVTEPRLLLLDEPLTALDVSAKTRMRSLLRRVLGAFDGVAVLVSHDPVDAMTLADRIVVIEHGRVTQSGTPDELRAAPRTRYAADLVGVNLFVGRLEPAEGAAILQTPGGEIACGAPEGFKERVDGAMGILRPADVSLYLDRPSGSARNVLSGPIAFINIDGERARVGVGASPEIVAEITVASLRGLGLVEGMAAWASFKALEVNVVLP
jgi:molybdate transport system ATP-binding protein